MSSKIIVNIIIYIQNLYNKEHFILITNNKKYYSYNYARNSFVEIPKEELTKNLETKKIGTYLNEKIPFIVKPEESYWFQ